MNAAINYLFYTDALLNVIILLGVLWSIFFSNKRIWPPPRKKSWQFNISWLLFNLVFLLNVLLVLLNWDSWILSDNIRFYLGVPLIIFGFYFVCMGIKYLGIQNTSGLKDKLITIGIYRYTRNPQYLGDIFLFVGISLIANSLYVLFVHLILTLSFILLPLSEEKWLEHQYKEEYLRYKKQTSRFF